MPIGIPMIPRMTPQKVVASLSEVVDWGQTFVEVGEYQNNTDSQGAGVNVAVLDTGIAIEHPDLKPNVINHMDFTDDDRPCNPHSTHVAGIIAATANNVGVRGVAPEAKLHSVRVLDADGLCPADFRYVIRGLEWVLKHPEIDIVNISLGAPIEPPARMHQLIRQLAIRGVLIVAATGNEGCGQVSYPARYDETIAVAAMDREGNITDFSNQDDTLDVLAPGVDVYSTWHNGGYCYARETGTSMAAPFISGVLSLMLSYHRDGNSHETPLTNHEDAIRHLQTFRHGKLSMGMANMGVGVVRYENANDQNVEPSADSHRPKVSWMSKLYDAIDKILRALLLRSE